MSGDIVQRNCPSDGAYAGNVVDPERRHHSAGGEGTQFMGASISPTSALNLQKSIIRALHHERGRRIHDCGVFRDATANSLCCSVSSQNSADPRCRTCSTDLAASTSSTTFQVLAGTASGQR